MLHNLTNASTQMLLLFPALTCMALNPQAMRSAASKLRLQLAGIGRMGRQSYRIDPGFGSGNDFGSGL